MAPDLSKTSRTVEVLACRCHARTRGPGTQQQKIVARDENNLNRHLNLAAHVGTLGPEEFHSP